MWQCQTLKYELATQANIYTMSENMYYNMIIIVPKFKQHFEYF